MGQVKMLRSVRKRELLPLGLAGTLRIDLLGQLEGVRIGQVHVGGGDGKNKAALPADELQDHVLDLVLDILGLVPHGHLGDAWEVNEGQVQHYGGNQRERPSRAGSRGGMHSPEETWPASPSAGHQASGLFLCFNWIPPLDSITPS